MAAYDDEGKFDYMDDQYGPQPNPEDVPTRIWANVEVGADGETFIEYLSDEPWSNDNPGVEYVKASPWRDMSDALHDGRDILTFDGNSYVVLFW